MQENTPINDSSFYSDDFWGESLKLLIFQEGFDKVMDGKDLKDEEEARE